MHRTFSSEETEHWWAVDPSSLHATDDSDCFATFPACHFANLLSPLDSEDISRLLNVSDTRLIHVPYTSSGALLGINNFSVDTEKLLNFGLVKGDSP